VYIIPAHITFAGKVLTHLVFIPTDIIIPETVGVFAPAFDPVPPVSKLHSTSYLKKYEAVRYISESREFLVAFTLWVFSPP
jgi:hypothetical protein